MNEEKGSILLRFTIRPEGAVRSPERLKSDILAALQEAVDRVRSETSYEVVNVEVEPEGGFLAEAAVLWLLKAAAGGAAQAAGKALFEFFSTALRQRNIILTDASSVTIAPESKEPESKEPEKLVQPSPKRKGVRKPGASSKAKRQTKRP
ncbi:MAG TPA: hypothetical protein VJX67_14905 [Blastocatellia bacterium]|nr:hypothetical protein [Blastocatellia bacterium]